MRIDKRAIRLLLIMIAFIVPLLIHAEERYLRYRLKVPVSVSVATVSIISHVDTPEVALSWDGVAIPGVISKDGLYVPAGTWSSWFRLPNPPVWGTFYLKFKLDVPAPQVKADLQIATFPDEKSVVRTMTVGSLTGTTVGFVLPRGHLLDHVKEIETLEEGMQRRRQVAQSVAVPVERRAKQLQFCPFRVVGDPTVKDSLAYEEETVKLLGFNLWGDEHASIPFFTVASAAASQDWIDSLKFSEASLKKLSFVTIFDEPGWYSGFSELWAKTGQQGFRDYLREQKLAPAFFGANSLDEISLLPLGQGCAADAPLPKRRLWYWSCRYQHDLGPDYFADLTRRFQAKYPTVPTTVNFTDHGILLYPGMGTGSSPDIFAYGRRNAVTMFFSEDWLFGGLNSWGNGMFQKVMYMADLLRAGARYQPKTLLGYNVIDNAYQPFETSTDLTISARINMLLGRGVKVFDFFVYGPTIRCTVDFWGDQAPAMRGYADAVQLCGGAQIEPYLYDGQPAPPQACMIYSIPAGFWQAANKADANSLEKQNLYCMLTQENISLDILDSTDLDRFIKPYKIAYLVDVNITAKSAAALSDWVKGGGTLVLWPGAAAKDEFNEPLTTFPDAAGQTRFGNGTIIRYADRPAEIWWKCTREMNEAVGRWWPGDFDSEQRKRVCQPALEIAGVERPVTTNYPAVIANALVSNRGVAVPLVNLQGLQTEGGLRYLNVTVKLADGTGITRAWSSRRGVLPLLREGKSVSVVMPLDYTDILVFSRQ